MSNRKSKPLQLRLLNNVHNLKKVLKQEDDFVDNMELKTSNYIYGTNNFYSEEFLKLFKKTLGSSSSFIKANLKNKNLTDQKVKDLFLVDNHYKYLLKKSVNQPLYLTQVLKSQFELFEKDYEKALYQRSEKKNVHRKYLIPRLTKFTTKLINFLRQNNPEIFNKRDTSYLNDKVVSDILRSIDSRRMFETISSTALKIAYKNILEDKVPTKKGSSTMDSDILLENTLNVIRHELHLAFEKVFLKVVFSEVIIFLHEKYDDAEERLTGDYLQNKLMLVNRFLNSKVILLEHEDFYEDFVASIHVILDIYIESTASNTEIEIVKPNSYSSPMKRIIISLPSGLSALLSFSDHLPQILIPKDWDEEGMCDELSLAKSIHFGSTEIKYDPQTIKAINSTQKKKFRINVRFIELLESLENLSLLEVEKLDLPFKNKASIESDENHLNNLKNSLTLNSYQKRIINFAFDREREFYSSRLQKFDKNEIWTKVCKVCNISSFDGLKYQSYVSKALEFKSNIYKKQIFFTKLRMANFYDGFPLYFRNVIDYRGRMYPLNYLFSRTTGFYKYLVKDYAKIKLTREGMIWFLKAYYTPSRLKLENFELFLKTSHPEGLEELYDYFQKSRLTLDELNANYLYFSLLEREIECLPNEKFKTDFIIEIDQKASFSTFISLILKIEKMARYSNLLGGPALDIYLHTQEYIEDFFSQNDIKSKTLLNAFLSIRDLSKKPFMFLIYGQEVQGRNNDWLETFEENGINLSQKDKAELFLFSNKYLSFLDVCFPRFEKKFRLLTELYEFLNEKSQTTSIRSLDGSIINWSFYFELIHTGSRYNPSRDRNENYHRVVPFGKLQMETVTKDLSLKIKKAEGKKNLSEFEIKKLKKHKNTLLKYRKSHANILKRKKSAFRPGFVHCLDGAVIRLLINAMKEKHNYDINHLHDSIQIHPNYVGKLYEEISIIYNDLASDNLVDYFTKQAHFLLNKTDSLEFERLVKEFESDQDDFGNSIKNMVPEHMYPFEN
jgi:hypothetical protein